MIFSNGIRNPVTAMGHLASTIARQRIEGVFQKLEGTGVEREMSGYER
jgi:hypothetical protein